MRKLPPLLALVAILVAGACASYEESNAQQATTAAHVDFDFQPITSKTLPRLLQLNDRIFSGAEPKVEQAFAELQKLGIKTIIGVDGARPKVEWAAKYGMEYVHIPIGYDGIETAQANAFAQVVREKPGPYYFHCHHGRHRGPAAAAIGFMADTQCGSEGGIAVLTHAQTSKNYPGLWRDVEAFEMPSASVKVELPAIAMVSDFEGAMAKMDRAWDEAKLIQKAGWKVSAEHPDLDPQRTALILSQTFEDLNATTPRRYLNKELFQEQMKVALSASSALSKALAGNNVSDADAAFEKVRKSCKGCHLEYRDQ